MPNYVDDPVMGLTIPVADERPGPTYAQDISNDLQIIALHKHTGAANEDGYQIPSAGLDIDEDLSFQSNNATSLRSTRFTSQGSTLGGVGDLNCLYVTNGEAYFNDGTGAAVQLTSNGSVNVNVSNYFSSYITTTNYTIDSTDGYAVINCQYTPPGATKLITLPLANTVQAGRFYYIKDGYGSAASVNITVTPSGSDTVENAANYNMNVNYSGVLVVSDGIDNWLAFPFVGPGALIAPTITISSTSGATTVTSATSISETATTSMVLAGGSTASLTAGSGALSLASTSSSVGITGNTGVTGTATTGNISLSATAGTASLTAGSGAITLTGSTNASLVGTAGTLTLTAGTSGTVTAGTSLGLTAGTSLTLTGQVYVPTKAVTSSPYTVDTTTKDYVIFVDSTSGAISINLPAASNGRYLIIQDVGGVANTNNITLVRNGSDTIQGVSGNYVLDADFQGVHLCAYSGGSWFIVAST